MTKAAADKEKTTTTDSSVEGYMHEINAKRLFVSSSVNMGWQLAVTVLVPLIGGVKLDGMLNSSPNFTLAGIFIAVGAGSAAVWNNVKQVNKDLENISKDDKDDVS